VRPRIGWVLWLGALTALGLLGCAPRRFHWIASAAAAIALRCLLLAASAA
jgi:hypothetical protein